MEDIKPSVAPRAGAWVETSTLRFFIEKAMVAPRAGAWVEASIVPSHIRINDMSHPVRVRGLKASTTT